MPSIKDIYNNCYANCSVLGMHSNLCLVFDKRTLLKSILLSFLSWKKTKKTLSFSLLGETGYYHIQATKPDTVGTRHIYIIQIIQKT